MSFLKNTVSLLAIFSIVPAAFAVTARPSVMNTATAVSATGAVRRMPTMSVYLTGGTTGGTIGGTTSDGSVSAEDLLDNLECIDAYTECIKSDDACGSTLSECTTNVLFHGKMSQCVSTLAQCASAGVYSLFGTSDVSALSNVYSTNSDNEVTRYTYPTDGSILGQMIISAAVENRYDTQTCVKRYMSCLNKDSVCGADFELCTSNREFKKQALFCDSTLARCQADGVRELFGSSSWTPSSGIIAGGSRVAAAIEDGAQLAAMNAVSTCYKVVEQCFLGSCASNPLRCIEGSTLDQVKAGNLLADDGVTATSQSDLLSKSDVNRYLRSSCQDIIGANKYCHMTFREKTPSNGELIDVEVQEEVFDAALDQRKKYIDSKVQDLMVKFDTKAKNKCAETIKSCAMRSCGDGVGSVCYSQVMGSVAKSINYAGNANGEFDTYTGIKTGCESIVNTDTNCQYAYASVKNQAYSYNFLESNAFNTLFPQYEDGAVNDPIGVVASLNASLSSSFSDAAIANMKKQCQAIATGCVKKMCGADYVNCYRNRTDILSDLTKTGDAGSGFDKSMNKVGGVLDYTVVLGLCMNTVKSADVCDEHLKIQKAKAKTTLTDSWGAGTTSVRSGWVDAGGAKSLTVADGIAKTDDSGNELCYNDKGMEGVCYDMDDDGDIFDEKIYESVETYLTNQSATTLFRELLTDLEYEAQAKYNAKLTKQQNMCLSSNNGGILGADDLGSTFMWVKLKNGKVPTNYTSAGLKANQIVASNDLYGSFCRVRVTLQSDDKNIQDAISNGADWSTTYFAAGDAFTCGSWIPGNKLEELAQLAGEDAREDKEASQPKIRGWMTALGAIGLGIGGTALGSGVAKGNALSGLTGIDKQSEKLLSENCSKAMEDFNAGVSNGNKNSITNSVNKMIRLTNSATSLSNDDRDSISQLRAALGDYNQEHAKNGTYNCTGGRSVTETRAAAKRNCSDTEKNSDKQKCEDTYFTTNCTKVDANVENKISELQGKMQAVNEICETKSVKKKTSGLGAGIGAAVGAVGGGLLGYYITDSILDAELDKAEQAAIDEFMKNVGSKIQCYIGGEEVGSYGQVISTSME